MPRWWVRFPDGILPATAHAGDRLGGPVTTPRDLALLRLVAQRIAGTGPADPAATVRWMTAMQAQDPRGVLTSVALRTSGGTTRAVRDAFDAGDVATSWPMRGTLHVVAARDLPWMLSLMAPRVIAAAATRRAGLGLDTGTLDRAGKLARDALSGGRRLARAELLRVWTAGGLDVTGQRGYHLLGYLAQSGMLCFGPVRGNQHLLVLVDEWIPDPRRPDRDEALGALALRYFRSHGPATVRDFTRWTKLVAADVRTGVAIARPDLDRVEVDGVEYLLDPATAGTLDGLGRRARGVFLLPGFDEYILGYADRGCAVPAEFADRIVPGGNGMFRATIVSDGRVVGTWSQTGRGADRTVAATPFTAFTPAVTAAISRAYASLPRQDD